MDSINVNKRDDEDDAWKWIHENIGVVQEVTGDGNCGYRSFIGACNHTKRTFSVNLTQMISTKQDLLKMQKDLKK